MKDSCCEDDVLIEIEEQLVSNIIEEHYNIIINEMIGVYPFQIAKEIPCSEFKRAKESAVLSAQLVLKYAQINTEENYKWTQIINKIKEY